MFLNLFKRIVNNKIFFLTYKILKIVFPIIFFFILFKNSYISYKPINKKLRIWNGFQNLNGDNILVVGDAASLCDPFLAEGIRPSLISSYYAAEIIDQCLLKRINNLNNYSKIIHNEWCKSMSWGRRIAQVFYRFPKTGYQLGVKRKTAPKRIAQILSGEMSYEDIAKRVIKRLLIKKEN